MTQEAYNAAILDPSCRLACDTYDDETDRMIRDWKISPHAAAGDFDRDCFWLTGAELREAIREAEAARQVAR
jgi:hypothetical protein